MSSNCRSVDPPPCVYEPILPDCSACPAECLFSPATDNTTDPSAAAEDEAESDADALAAVAADGALETTVSSEAQEADKGASRKRVTPRGVSIGPMTTQHTERMVCLGFQGGTGRTCREYALVARGTYQATKILLKLQYLCTTTRFMSLQCGGIAS